MSPQLPSAKEGHYPFCPGCQYTCRQDSWIKCYFIARKAAWHLYLDYYRASQQPERFGDPKTAEQIAETTLEFVCMLNLEGLVLGMMDETGAGAKASREPGKYHRRPKSASHPQV